MLYLIENAILGLALVAGPVVVVVATVIYLYKRFASIADRIIMGLLGTIMIVLVIALFVCLGGALSDALTAL